MNVSSPRTLKRKVEDFLDSRRSRTLFDNARRMLICDPVNPVRSGNRIKYRQYKTLDSVYSKTECYHELEQDDDGSKTVYKLYISVVVLKPNTRLETRSVSGEVYVADISDELDIPRTYIIMAFDRHIAYNPSIVEIGFHALRKREIGAKY